MKSYNSFTFEEVMSPFFGKHLRPEFIINQNISAEAVLIRVLTGTLKVTNNFSTDKFDQKRNYSILGSPENKPISTKPIKLSIEPESNLNKLCYHLNKSRRNNKFFENLLEEFSSYFYKTTKLSHTTAFIHLYRILEYISYSFPLAYASLDRDYYGSFDKLKNYFLDDSKNELLFFDSFLSKLFDNVVLDSPVEFNFNTLNVDVDKKHYTVFKTYLPDGSITGDIQNVQLITSYRYLLNLSIQLRNRYFHFAVGGRRNIRNTDVVENDAFFYIINNELANWLAYIYFEILKHLCEKY